MPYSILTKDGIQIDNIPDDVAEDSQELKDRVAKERAKIGSAIPVNVVSEPPKSLFGRAVDLFTGESRETPEIRSLEELGMAPEVGGLSLSALKTSLGLLATGDEAKLKNIIKSNIPEAEFRVDEKNNTIVDFPSGSYALNKPGLSGQDFARFATQALAFTPAGRAAVAPGGTVAMNAAIGGVGSGLTELGLQETAKGLGGGDVTGSEVAQATVLGVGAELLAPGLKGIISRLRQSHQNRVAAKQSLEAATLPESARQVAKAEETTRQTGVRFLRAQQTQDPFQLEEQAFLAQLPEGSRQAMQSLKTQDTESAMAVEAFMSHLAPSRSVPSARPRIRESAKGAVRLREAVRRNRTSQLYNDAFDQFRASGNRVDVSTVTDEIDLRLQQFPESHPAHRSLLKFRNEIIENADDLQKLQGVKETIDLEIANLAPMAPNSSAIAKANAQVSAIQDTLLERMDDASPAFREARAAFARESVPVDRIRQSVVGQVAELSDAQLKRTSQMLLDPAEATTKSVRLARRAILGQPNGREHWDAIVRTEMERRLGKAKNSLEAVMQGNQRAMQNVPAQMLNALIPNDNARAVLLAGMDQGQRANFEFLEDALRRAASGRPGGSQTGIRKEISRRFGSGVVAGIARFLRNPIESVGEIGEEGARAARVSAVANMAFNPDWNRAAAEIRRVQRAGNHTRAEQLTIDLLNNLEKSVIARSALQSARSE